MVACGQLTWPTPCSSWDPRALLHHVADSLAALDEGLGCGRVEALPVPAGSGDDLVATVRALAMGLIGRTARPGMVRIADRALNVRVLSAVRALELTGHSWDVARACRRDRPIPARLAADLLAVAPMAVTGATCPDQFGAPMPVSPAVGCSDRLVAFLGRDPATDRSAATQKISGLPVPHGTAPA